VKLALLAASLLVAGSAAAQNPNTHLNFLNHNQPILDAHNCYPYDGKWTDRVARALNSGYPVSIEQDLAWYVDPATGAGRVVVSHSDKPKGTEPTLKESFFDQARPVIEKAIKENHKDRWPLIVLHFDFKDNSPEIIAAVWKLLGENEPWLSTAIKTQDANVLSPLDRKPILVVTEESDAQQKVFYDDVPVGTKLRVFGSAHTKNPPAGLVGKEIQHWEATAPVEDLFSERPTNYRRWWNSSWYTVEEGGQHGSKNGPTAWTDSDDKRLRALVNHAHELGYWIRFYTLDGFAPSEDRGWGNYYNYGSREAVIPRWKAAIAAGVNFVASDQYEDLAEYMKQNSQNLRPGNTK
jgi:hypothetical protein